MCLFCFGCLFAKLVLCNSNDNVFQSSLVEHNQRKENHMLQKMRNRKGFTLIELLIVVAIIGILAAIAIPQFAAYRMRGYNSAANSDIKNFKTSLEAFYTDNQMYP